LIVIQPVQFSVVRRVKRVLVCGRRQVIPVHAGEGKIGEGVALSQRSDVPLRVIYITAHGHACRNGLFRSLMHDGLDARPAGKDARKGYIESA